MSERPFSQVPVPLIVAHRGASAVEAENTLASFEAAVSSGAGAVEFDVRVTADGRAVVMHDPTVDRTTDGMGLVAQLSMRDVKRLRIATQRGLAEVPTLHEALAALSGRVAVDIEIKNIPGELDFDPSRERAVELVHAALDDVAFVGPVIVSSFNPLSLAASRAAHPEVATGLLTEDGVEAAAALHFSAEQGHRWVLPFIDRVRAAGPSFAEAVHDTGLLLGTWITDDPDEARALLATGVDAVATNDPAAIVAACAWMLPG